MIEHIEFLKNRNDQPKEYISKFLPSIASEVKGFFELYTTDSFFVGNPYLLDIDDVFRDEYAANEFLFPTQKQVEYDPETKFVNIERNEILQNINKFQITDVQSEFFFDPSSFYIHIKGLPKEFTSSYFYDRYKNNPVNLNIYKWSGIMSNQNLYAMKIPVDYWEELYQEVWNNLYEALGDAME